LIYLQLKVKNIIMPRVKITHSGGGGMKVKRLKFASLFITVLLLISPANAAGSLNVQSMDGQSNRPYLEYSYSYPRITGLGDSINQQHVNVRLKERAMKAVKSAELASQTATEGLAIKGSFGFNVKRNDGGILSIELNETLTGNSSPVLLREGMNIDTVSGKILKLQDLFKENADYKGLISDIVKKQLKTTGLDKKQLREFKTINNYEEFYLTQNELVILPEPGKYFSQKSGIIEFVISLKSLEDALKP
jgi:hypothetical protein